MFIKSYTNKYNNLVLRQKCTNNLYVESGILQKLRDCFLNTTCMRNILRKKFKYNIATYNLNEHICHTKQSQLSYSLVLREISVLRIRTNFLRLN